MLRKKVQNLKYSRVIFLEHLYGQNSSFRTTPRTQDSLLRLRLRRWELLHASCCTILSKLNNIIMRIVRDDLSAPTGWLVRKPWANCKYHGHHTLPPEVASRLKKERSKELKPITVIMYNISAVFNKLQCYKKLPYFSALEAYLIRSCGVIFSEVSHFIKYNRYITHSIKFARFLPPATAITSIYHISDNKSVNDNNRRDSQQ